MILFGLDAGAELPQAHLDRLEPGWTNQGEVVEFVGHGSGGEGSITGYRWRSSLDGEFGATANLSYGGLDPGNHTIFFSVRDETGNWSAEVAQALDINALPVAIIDERTPVLVNAGEAFMLFGNGSDSDGQIEDVQWFSPTLGGLGDSLTVHISGWSAGVYEVGLWVKDDHLARSPIVMVNITVNGQPKITTFELASNLVRQGTDIVFQLEGQDPEDEPLEFLFQLDAPGESSSYLRRGPLQTSNVLNSTSIPPANYTLQVYLTDGSGGLSEPALNWLYLNAPPVVNFSGIDKLPNPQLTVYQLQAQVSDEGTALVFQWRSSLVGLLPSNDSSANYYIWEFPPVGSHTLSVRAMDEWGLWSDWAYWPAQFIIQPPPAPPATVETGFLGLEGQTGVILVVLLVVLIGTTLVTWQGGRLLLEREVVEPRERMAEMIRRHQDLGLAYPMERYQHLMEQEARLVKLPTLRQETRNLERLLKDKLELYDEVHRLMVMARGWATKAESAGVEYEYEPWEAAQMSFREGELERARAQARKATSIIKERLGAAETEGLDLEHVSGEGFDQWAKPEGPGSVLQAGADTSTMVTMTPGKEEATTTMEERIDPVTGEVLAAVIEEPAASTEARPPHADTGSLSPVAGSEDEPVAEVRLPPVERPGPGAVAMDEPVPEATEETNLASIKDIATIAADNLPSTTLAGTPLASPDGTAPAGLAGTPSTTLAGTPSTTLAGTPSTTLAGTPSTTLAGTPSVPIDDLPSAPIDDTPSNAGRTSSDSHVAPSISQPSISQQSQPWKHSRRGRSRDRSMKRFRKPAGEGPAPPGEETTARPTGGRGIATGPVLDPVTTTGETAGQEFSLPEETDPRLEFPVEQTWTGPRQREGRQGHGLDDRQRREIEATVAQRSLPLPGGPTRSKRRRGLLGSRKERRPEKVRVDGQTTLEVEPGSGGAGPPSGPAESGPEAAVTVVSVEPIPAGGDEVVVEVTGEPMVEVTGEPVLSPEEQWRQVREQARAEWEAAKARQAADEEEADRGTAERKAAEDPLARVAAELVEARMASLEEDPATQTKAAQAAIEGSNASDSTGILGEETLTETRSGESLRVTDTKGPLPASPSAEDPRLIDMEESESSETETRPARAEGQAEPGSPLERTPLDETPPEGSVRGTAPRPQPDTTADLQEPVGPGEEVGTHAAKTSVKEPAPLSESTASGPDTSSVFEVELDGSVTCRACGTVADLELGYDELAGEFICPGCGSLGPMELS